MDKSALLGIYTEEYMSLPRLRGFHILLLVFAVLFLAGCEKVSDARGEFCDDLQNVGEVAVDFKEAKVDEPIDEFRSKVENLQKRKRNLERLAKLIDVPALDRLIQAIDNAAEVVNTVSGNTIGPVVDKIQAAGARLEEAYLELDEAVCAAK